MSTNVSIEEAQAKLREIIASLGPDDEIVITEGEQPIAKLVLDRSKKQRPGPGLCKGMITIVSDDDEHLKDFSEYMP
jgi:antitoxin (DNA-binding transcriptional repressor) of toxin-antitoxin stability system